MRWWTKGRRKAAPTARELAKNECQKGNKRLPSRSSDKSTQDARHTIAYVACGRCSSVFYHISRREWRRRHRREENHRQGKELEQEVTHLKSNQRTIKSYRLCARHLFGRALSVFLFSSDHHHLWRGKVKRKTWPGGRPRFLFPFAFSCVCVFAGGDVSLPLPLLLSFSLSLLFVSLSFWSFPFWGSLLCCGETFFSFGVSFSFSDFFSYI